MIRGIEALRAIAVWMVVMHHLRAQLGSIWPPLADTLVFAAGVDLFFVISGVVMVVSTADGATGTGAFLAKRALRILPLYWLVTLTILVALLAGLSPLGIGGWTGQDALMSFLLLPDIRADGYPAPLLSVGWTLIFEAFFYLIFGLALSVRRYVQPGLVVVAVLVCLVGGGFAAAPAVHAAQIITSPLLLEFGGGVLLGLAMRHMKSAVPFLALTSVLIAPIILWFGTVQLAQMNGGGDLITMGRDVIFWRVLAFGVPALLVVASALMVEASAWRLSPLIARQAAASYAIYLVHMPLLQVGTKLIGEGSALILMIPVVALSGLTVHRWFEKPMTRGLRQMFAAQHRPKSSSRRMISSSSR